MGIDEIPKVAYLLPILSTGCPGLASPFLGLKDRDALPSCFSVMGIGTFVLRLERRSSVLRLGYLVLVIHVLLRDRRLWHHHYWPLPLRQAERWDMLT